MVRCTHIKTIERARDTEMKSQSLFGQMYTYYIAIERGQETESHKPARGVPASAGSSSLSRDTVRTIDVPPHQPSADPLSVC